MLSNLLSKPTSAPAVLLSNLLRTSSKSVPVILHDACKKDWVKMITSNPKLCQVKLHKYTTSWIFSTRTHHLKVYLQVQNKSVLSISMPRILPSKVPKNYEPKIALLLSHLCAWHKANPWARAIPNAKQVTSKMIFSVVLLCSIFKPWPLEKKLPMKQISHQHLSGSYGQHPSGNHMLQGWPGRNHKWATQGLAKRMLTSSLLSRLAI